MTRTDWAKGPEALINAAAVGVRFSAERIRCWVWGMGDEGGGEAWRSRSSFTPAATHGFDDPSAKRQHVEANAAEAVEQAVRFFRERLGERE